VRLAWLILAMVLCCDSLPDCADGSGFGETTIASAHALARI